MPRWLSLLVKVAAGAAALAAVGLIAATVALKVLLPPEKIRALIVEQTQKNLNREVRLKGVSLGVLKGLSIEGLEVSEKPDFKAGTFAGMEAFQLKVKLLPLLSRKVVVDRIAVSGPSLTVIRGKGGRFNFADLASGEPAKKAPAKDPAVPSLPFELAVDRASLTGGRIEYRDQATGERWIISELQALARDFRFDEGRLSARLEKFAADVMGLKLGFSATVNLDPARLDIPDMKGRIGDGTLSGALTVKDYLKAPDLQLEASLSELDLDAVMAAKEAAAGQAAAKAQTPAPAATPAQAGWAAPPMRAKGSVTVGKLAYSGLSVGETNISWDLVGITPDMKGLGGWAKLHAAGGTFGGSGKESKRSGLVKVLLLPVTVLKKVGSLLSPLKLLPDFSHLAFDEVVGDYAFDHGVMTIRDFHMDGAAVKARTTGTIDLAAQRLNLLVSAAAGGALPIEIDVTGTFDSPSPKPRLTKALAAPVRKITEAAGKLFKGLFKK